VAAAVPAGRLSVLGEAGGHVRWHVLPLPAGVPSGLSALAALGLPGPAPREREALAATLRMALAP
jgi:hypothetical protein